MERKGLAMCPYFETVASAPDNGLVGFYDGPRYSTGYNALFDRIGILSETHMLKPYADRVNATFQLMLATLAFMDQHPEQLREARNAAKAHTADMDEIGLNWELDTTVVERIPWKGYTATMQPSKVSGLPRLHYDHDRPVDITVPWMDTYRPTQVVRKPAAYLVPKQWRAVIQRLEANGVKCERLAKDTRIRVEQDSIGAFNTVQQPYEGHYLHRGIHARTMRVETTAHQGDVLVRLGQYTDRYVMETLECTAEDGFFAWNFFDAQLQQKEWFSDYVFEDIAADLLERDPALRAALEARRVEDPCSPPMAGRSCCSFTSVRRTSKNATGSTPFCASLTCPPNFAHADTSPTCSTSRLVFCRIPASAPTSIAPLTVLWRRMAALP